MARTAEDMLSHMKRYVEEHDYTLAELEEDWRSEEHAPWTHELEEITGYVLGACEAASRALVAKRAEHKGAMREWMAARAWADREIRELRLREV
jgi:hypothetical protein